MTSQDDKKERERAKAAQGLQALRDEVPYMLERFALLAKLQKAKYDELIKAGFEPAQALELCKAVF